MFSQSYNGKHFFLLVKEETYFSKLGTVCNGLGMVFIHNSFGNNTYNIRQPSCLQLFKRNLTPLLRQKTLAKGSSVGFFFLWKTDHTIVLDERVAKKLRDHFQTNIFLKTGFFPQSFHPCDMNYCIFFIKLPSTAQLFIFVITGFHFICLPFDPVLIVESFNNQGICRLKSI